MNNREKGLFFEGKARIFLESNGFKILVSNARWRKTEVDIICEKYNNGMNEIYSPTIPAYNHSASACRLEEKSNRF